MTQIPDNLELILLNISGHDRPGVTAALTEILARQHYATFQRMLEGMDVRVAILTGASKARERREALAGIADGSIDLLIGTNAIVRKVSPENSMF